MIKITHNPLFTKEIIMVNPILSKENNKKIHQKINSMNYIIFQRN